MKNTIFAITLGALLSSHAIACTTAIVTKGASADGSVYVTHSNDGYSGDTSIVFVPAADHEEGEMRQVYPSACAREAYPDFNCDYTPRLNVQDRGPDYSFEGVELTNPIGEIPQVAHTYAYLDSNYGIINEHGLMLGECTDNSNRMRYIRPDAGTGLFYSSELGRIALERCKTASEAIDLMGKLIDEYGLWGTAETLLVGDKEEAWVLEMMPNPSGKGGFWVAQKVPDGEFFIAANQFRIRALDENNPDQRFNLSMIAELKNIGWAEYDKDGKLDWLRSIQTVEHLHPYYSLRRVWRAMDIVAPSKNFSAWADGYDTYAYPFSVKPDKLITLQDIMEIHRDTYQNTEFDYSNKETGGLFAFPYCFSAYNKERVLSTTSISYIWINQANDKLPAPISWLALTSPAESVYVPLPVAPLTEVYSRVDRKHYDASKLYWAVSSVGTITRAYYSLLAPYVKDYAHTLESKSYNLVQNSLTLPKDDFNKVLYENAKENNASWRALSHKLIQMLDNNNKVLYAKGHVPENTAPTSYKAPDED